MVCKTSDSVLLTCAQMGQVDGWAAQQGASGQDLMAAAGRAVADAIRRRWAPRPVAVWCGPGNNGGDGFVVAAELLLHGWPVSLACTVPWSALRGDALWHAERWRAAEAQRQGLSPAQVQWSAPCEHLVQEAQLVVDALWGAGLARPVPPELSAMLRAAVARGVPLVAVDVPSGVSGDSGADLGATASTLTVTFHALKRGHVLMPGRALCGELVCADIGVPQGWSAALSMDDPPLPRVNHPMVWHGAWPQWSRGAHKYSRGHVALWGGARLVGAARLAAQAGARVGAGLVSLWVPASAWAVYAGGLASVMAHALDDTNAERLCAAWQQALEGRRWEALALGPGALSGLPGDATTLRWLTAQALAAERVAAVVLDADAITVHAGHLDALARAVAARPERPVVLTPHEGEFTRLFGGPASDDDKITRTLAAARRVQAVVLHKGADTVIASPDGRVIVNTTGTAHLATAGAGDVLTGLVAGLLAQGMPAFEAACAAAWVHGMCAQVHGPGLVAEDLPAQLPQVLNRLAGGEWR